MYLSVTWSINGRDFQGKYMDKEDWSKCMKQPFMCEYLPFLWENLYIMDQTWVALEILAILVSKTMMKRAWESLYREIP